MARVGESGEFPEAGLTVDPATGILYGTTFGALGTEEPGKNCGKGRGTANAFQSGGNTAYAFQGGGDGAFPTGEVVEQNGTVYGTTEFGGGTSCNGLGCGTVFAVQGGTEEGLYVFCHSGEFPTCLNGANPHAGPIMGIDGYLYGTTSLGGSGTGSQCDNNFGGCGTIYKLSTSLQKGTETVLHSFCQAPGCPDGAVPSGRLWQDQSSGNLYGTTQFGGMYGQGIIFEFNLTTKQYTPLYSFCLQTGCSDGAVPEAALVEDPNGNFYGTASAGGVDNCQSSSPGCGVVFELTPAGAYNVIYAFQGGMDGALPLAQLAFDASTNTLYGTTEKGGNGPNCQNPVVGCGTVFALRHNRSGWTEKFLHKFGYSQSHHDGAQPEGAVSLNNGTLYGATRVYGSKRCNCGTLYTIAVGGGQARKPRKAHASVRP